MDISRRTCSKNDEKRGVNGPAFGRIPEEEYTDSKFYQMDFEAT